MSAPSAFRSAFAAAAVLLAAAASAQPARERIALDPGWRFALGNAADVHADFDFGSDAAGKGNARALFAKAGLASGPARPEFDDSGWERVQLPHDWAVALPFDPKADKDHGFKPLGRAFPATSIGWYRRGFDLPAGDLGRRLSIEFDGVYRDSMVWLNGHYLGREPSGYAGFSYDVTDVANYGGRNVLVVRVDASQFEGWFYEGAGIYRHAWLVKTAPLHVARRGVFVTSALEPAGARITVRTRVANESDRPASFSLGSGVAGEGAAASTETTLAPWEERELTQELRVPRPRLWSPDSPALYRLDTSVAVDGRAVDAVSTTFGIKEVRFDPDHGFFLNGRRLEILGTCNHQDHAGVGAAIPDSLQAYRLRRLKEMGSNAYRTSHNPPTPELLDACDRLGLLVLDETRLAGSGGEQLGQLESMIRRDRNHASVFLWSLGNEETAIQGTETGARVLATMQRLAHRLDPSRLCTVGINYQWGLGFSKVADVMGINYIFRYDLDAYHRAHPGQPIVGTEDASNVSTRGIYETDRARGYVAPYDETVRTEKAARSSPEKWWPFFAAREYLPGSFIWTGFDYRGEPTPFDWPVTGSHFGVMDACGFPKEYFYYYRAWWSGRPVLKLFPHWNWAGREGRPIEVRAYGNAEEVELLLNGRSLGRRPMPRNGHLAWSVAYAPGTLEAVGYSGRREVSRDRVETTGTPAALRLEPDRAAIAADGADAAVVDAAVVDARGRVVPTAGDEIEFSVAGGVLLGVGNGDPASLEGDRGPRRRAFNGLAQLIVRSTPDAGPIEVSARAPGLAPARVVIEAGR